MLNKTSKLDAVNLLLSSIDQSPINSLSQTTVDVTRAIQALDKASREVQTIGWKFNTLEDFPLAPNTSGEVITADNTLSVDLDPQKYAPIDFNVVLLGNNLFNLVGSTYKFTETLKATVIIARDWDEMPEHARNYITMKARRAFQNDSLGSDQANQVESQDELQAFVRFKQLETRTRHLNFLTTFQRVYGWVGKR